MWNKADRLRNEGSDSVEAALPPTAALAAAASCNRGRAATAEGSEGEGEEQESSDDESTSSKQEEGSGWESSSSEEEEDAGAGAGWGAAESDVEEEVATPSGMHAAMAAEPAGPLAVVTAVTQGRGLDELLAAMDARLDAVFFGRGGGDCGGKEQAELRGLGVGAAAAQGEMRRGDSRPRGRPRKAAAETFDPYADNLLLRRL